MSSLMKSYLSVLNEDAKKGSGIAVDNTGELEGAENAKKFVKDSGPEHVKVTKPVAGPSQEDVKAKDAAPKAVKSESVNPFDVIINKVLANENWELEDDNGGGDAFGGLKGPEDNDFSAGDDAFGSTEGEEDAFGAEGEGEEEEGLAAVLTALKSAVEALEKVVNPEGVEGEEGEEEFPSAEGEEEEGEEEENSFPGSSAPVSEESVDAEELGTPIKDSEKLSKGMNSKSNQQVKGAVPVTKKKAVGIKPYKPTDGPEAFNHESDLTDKKKQNVGGVTVGKSLFDQ